MKIQTKDKIFDVALDLFSKKDMIQYLLEQ